MKHLLKEQIFDNGKEKFLIYTYGGNIKRINRLSSERIEVIFTPVSGMQIQEMDTPIIFNRVENSDNKIYIRCTGENSKIRNIKKDELKSSEYIICLDR